MAPARGCPAISADLLAYTYSAQFMTKHGGEHINRKHNAGSLDYLSLFKYKHSFRYIQAAEGGGVSPKHSKMGLNMVSHCQWKSFLGATLVLNAGRARVCTDWIENISACIAQLEA